MNLKVLYDKGVKAGVTFNYVTNGGASVKVAEDTGSYLYVHVQNGTNTIASIATAIDATDYDMVLFHEWGGTNATGINLYCEASQRTVWNYTQTNDIGVAQRDGWWGLDITHLTGTQYAGFEAHNGGANVNRELKCDYIALVKFS